MLKTMSKNQLKADMLNIFQEIEMTGKELVVTDNDQPVLRITPFKKGYSVQELFGDLRGQVVYHEDINNPTLDEWDDA